MPLRLDSAQPDFATAFEALLTQKREVSEEVDTAVSGIIAQVRTYGDEALLSLTRTYDRVDLTAATIRVSDAEIAEARAAVDGPTLEALTLAKARIEAFHLRQLPANADFVDEQGVRLGWRWGPVESVGLYVPGGTASYPSSVLMNAVPARVAGVPRVVMVVPAPDGVINPLVLTAASLGGVHEIYRVGGAQAIAALAYGTPSIAPVVKIVGPGNAYVAAAKRQVFGQVGIDMVAGPSEVLIVADNSANAEWIAADLLAQAEHDPAAQSILITNDAVLADTVATAVDGQMASLSRREIALASWRDFGAIIVVDDLLQAAELTNRLAPEHLEVMTIDPDGFAGMVRNAGAIFLGHHTPEAIGDYVGGSNHVLPTARSARFASGLGVLDFLKRTSILACDAQALRALAPAAIRLGESESLQAHARSVSIRLNLA